ncbi:DUF922 domain-containing protein [Vibrio apostichopi]|uniref:DUF922 domain-containing protein n=1 Tax=Vibrio apostichopi TaxID=3035453 RepID=UPI0025731E63|nr:DUF922 domain-containing protein [Vibrio sp. FE10]
MNSQISKALRASVWAVFSHSIMFSHMAMSETLPLGYSLSVEYQPYTVTGNTVDEIKRSFREDKPQHLKDSGFDGLTNWQYKTSHNSETCKLSKLDVSITYTLPQIQRSQANREAVDEFKFYMGQLYRHEEMHCAIAAKLFQEVYLAYKQGESGDCKHQLTIVEGLYARLQQESDEFDSYTNHGATELAVSPFGEEAYYTHCRIKLSKYPSN